MNTARPTFIVTTACVAGAVVWSCAGRTLAVGKGAPDDAGAASDASSVEGSSVEGSSEDALADSSSASETEASQVDGPLFAPPNVLATGQAPGFLALDSTNVYWSNDRPPPAGASGQGQIMECALGGCPGSPVSLWSGLYGVNGLGATGLDVYWPTGAGPGISSPPVVMTCAAAGCGGAPSNIADVPDNIRGFTTDGTNAYWTTNAGLVRICALSGCGGAPTTLASQQNGPGGIAVDATNIYWANNDDGTVATCPISGCSGGPSILASGRQRPIAVAVDASRLYWIELGMMVGGGKIPVQEYTGGQVVACSLPGCGGSPAVLAAYSSWLGGGAIATDGQHVYWSTEDTGGTYGEIVTCSVSGCGGQPMAIARTQTGQYATIGLGLSSGAVYWTDMGAGEVLSLSK
jgi:hypothetical protein